MEARMMVPCAIWMNVSIGLLFGFDVVEDAAQRPGFEFGWGDAYVFGDGFECFRLESVVEWVVVTFHMSWLFWYVLYLEGLLLFRSGAGNLSGETV